MRVIIHMLQKSTREEKLGCLFGLVGGVLGFLLGGHSFAAEVNSIHAIDPDATVCGLPAVAMMLGGMIVGAIGGTVFGMVVSHVLPPPELDS
jgi:hypothetical protein